jgi:hypothetical protein
LRGLLPEALRIDEEEAVTGFYTTRFVEAPFDKAAADVAIALFRSEQKYRDLRNQLSADPVIDADEVEPWDEVPDPKARKTGLVFYSDTEDAA